MSATTLNNKVMEAIFDDVENDSLSTVRTTSKGEFSPTGLKTDLLTTTMSVGTTPVKLPATALVGRNSIELHNLDLSLTLYVGKTSSVTADAIIGTTSGKEIDAGSFWSLDITPDIDLYGVVASGSILLKVTEVA